LGDGFGVKEKKRQARVDCVRPSQAPTSTYKSPIFLTLKPLIDSFFHALQIKTCANSNKTNSTTFISCVIHSHECHLKKLWHSHFKLCTSPIAQALPLSKYSQNTKSSAHQVSQSLSPFVSTIALQ
jgi:hypothetical protein